MKKKIEPTDTVGSIFTTRRDLVQCVKAAIAGSGFTLEQSDLLVSLYGIRELGWDDLPHDADGYATFKELELFLVHSATLLSRRIRKLAATKPQLVEVAGPATRIRMAFQLAAGPHYDRGQPAHPARLGAVRPDVSQPAPRYFSAPAGGPSPGQRGDQRPDTSPAAGRPGLSDQSLNWPRWLGRRRPGERSATDPRPDRHGGSAGHDHDSSLR